MKTPKLPLSEGERATLRGVGVRVADFVRLPLAELQQRTGWEVKRVGLLKSLALFQQLPAVGPATAGDFVLLGFSHPQELADQDPERLFCRLKELTHSNQDPCVLDMFQCAVYYVSNPGAPPDRPWWYWSQQRLAK